MFGLFKKDPEVIRILDRLVDRLKNTDEWETTNDHKYDYIRHKDFNIKVAKHIISEPKQVFIYLRYWSQRKFIKTAIKKVYRHHEVSNLNFVYDIIDGKYPYQESIQLNDEQLKWLDENSKEGDYIYKLGWMYFIDEALAMAFKLRFGK